MNVFITCLQSTIYYVDVQYLSMYLTYLLANEIFHCAHEYLPYLPDFSIPHSIFSHREEGKEKRKRKKKDVVNFAL